MATIIQIYGAEHYDDAVAIASMGVEHLGFRIEDPLFFQRQGICLSVQAARHIFEVLPPQTKTIALFATPDENLILRTVHEAQPTMVQPCWDIDAMIREREARLYERLRPAKVMKAIPIGGPETGQFALETAFYYQDVADFLILDTHDPKLKWVGAVGHAHDWTISREIVQQVRIPCILAGGLDASNVADALRTVRPWGVDSYSRTNLPNARKDLAKVHAFIDAVRRFDSEFLGNVSNQAGSSSSKGISSSDV